MDNSKYVDLHKIAAIFRGIQEEEFAKKEVDVSDTMEDAVEEDNAFNTAAAKAALAGDKEFSFNGKKYPVKMSKDDAKKLLDAEINSEEPVTEEPTNEAMESDEVKAIMAKHPQDVAKMKQVGDIDTESELYKDLFGYYMDSGEMPYGTMKARDGDPVEWIMNRLDDMGMVEAKEKDAEDVLKKGMEDEIADTLKNKIEDEESTDDTDVQEAHELGRDDKMVLAKLMKELDGYKSMTASETDRDDKMYKERLRDLESMIKNVTSGRPIDTALQDELSDMYDEVKEDTEVSEEPQGEQVAVMSTDTLSQILQLAGMKQVSDADINQPEASSEEVEEYANSPEEEYADTDFMTNKLAGGVNRPKKFPNVGNQGHNDLVQKLTKAYNEQKD